MATLLQYLGPKAQKRVISVPSKPIFNKANNFTCAVPEQDAARIIDLGSGETVAGGHTLFRVVDSMKEPRPKEVEEAAEDFQVPRRRRTEPQPYGGVETDPETGRVTTTPPNQPMTEMDRGKQLFGTTDGNPYATEGAARMQISRLAKKQGVEVDALEVVGIDDGYYITFAETEE